MNPPTYEDTENFKNARDLLNIPVSDMISQVSTRGDANNEFHQCIIDMHRVMRENYLEMIYKVGRNLYPLIIARDTQSFKYGDDMGRQGVGIVYTLYLEDGTSYTVAPTPRPYEMWKALSHIPLGLFTILSPYFSNPTATKWKTKVNAYFEMLLTTFEAFEHLNDPDFDVELARNFLETTREYLAMLLEKNSVTTDDYEDFTGKLRPLIIQAMKHAAHLQISAGIEAMKKWKTMLGDKWDDVIVAIPVIWPVAEHSPRHLIFKSLMNADKLKTNLFLLQGPKDDEEVKTLLGRIIADRLVGRFAFHPNDDEKGKRLFQCLSSHTDIMSDACHEELEQLYERETEE